MSVHDKMSLKHKHNGDIIIVILLKLQLLRNAEQYLMKQKSNKNLLFYFIKNAYNYTVNLDLYKIILIYFYPSQHSPWTMEKAGLHGCKITYNIGNLWD